MDAELRFSRQDSPILRKGEDAPYSGTIFFILNPRAQCGGSRRASPHTHLPRCLGELGTGRLYTVPAPKKLEIGWGQRASSGMWEVRIEALFLFCH